MVDNNEIWVFLSHSNKDYEKALEWLNAAKFEDGLAVENQIERVEEKMKKQCKRD